MPRAQSSASCTARHMEKLLVDLKRSSSEPPVMNSVTIMNGWCLVTAPRNCT